MRRRLGALVGGLVAYAFVLALPGDASGWPDTIQRVLATAIPLAAAGICFGPLAKRPGELRAWRLIGAAALLWGLGNMYYGVFLWDAATVPFPSPADAGYLLFYIPAYAGFVSLVRAQVRVTDGTLWIDGLIGTLAAGAVVAAIVLTAVLKATAGPTATVVINLAYPVADLILLGLVVGALNTVGWRGSHGWALLGSAFGIFAIADSVYLFQVAEGSYATGGVIDLGWPLAFVAVAAAAALPSAPAVRAGQADEISVMRPVFFSLVALGLLVYDHFQKTNVVVLVLAASCMVAALARLQRTFSAYRAMVRVSRMEAITDALTGLSNRRRLFADLRYRLARADAPAIVASFDLDGFKAYNDTFGHPAGDDLLARVADKLVAALGEHGRAYRTGGDEFVAIVDAGPDAEQVVRNAGRALHEAGDGFKITSSYGSVRVPAEAATMEEAIRIADQRMYQAKHGGRASARNQSAGVLVSALRERYPDLDPHLSRVSDVSTQIATHLGIDAQDCEEIRLAAELHDIGKVAIPDTILTKPAALDTYEREFVKRHSEIGERIISAAPALAPLARIVRAVHERVDGTGYPDGLAGEDIPLAARIIAVADALDAMLESRPYAAPLGLGDALKEIRRCSGTQFDAVVVRALTNVLVERGTEELLAAVDDSALVMA